jgi:hypothetical protein
MPSQIDSSEDRFFHWALNSKDTLLNYCQNPKYLIFYKSWHRKEKGKKGVASLHDSSAFHFFFWQTE